MIIMGYLKEREKKGIINNALFISSKYPFKRLSNRSVEKEISKIAKAAGINIPVFPHKLRHSSATMALAQGMKITSIQKILGHSNLDTTMIYVDVNNEDVKSEFKKLNQ
mgnify:CR=1 FL=1